MQHWDLIQSIALPQIPSGEYKPLMELTTA